MTMTKQSALAAAVAKLPDAVSTASPAFCRTKAAGNHGRWRLVVAVAMALAALAISSTAEARTRGFCYLNAWPFSGNLAQIDCGRDDQVTCDVGNLCDAGHRALYLADAGHTNVIVSCSVLPDETISAICASCGAENEIACAAPNQCDAGLGHVTTDELDGPIAECASLLPADPPDVKITVPAKYVLGVLVFAGANYSFTLPSSAAFINAYGTCSDGLPDDLAGASRESWPATEPASQRQGAVVFVHGRSASCRGKDSLLHSSGGMLFERNHRMYCIEYDQPDTNGRTVRVYEPTEQSPVSCAAEDTCTWNLDAPVIEIDVPAYSVPGVAAAMAEALQRLPTLGEIAVVAHSQGGFIVRALLHEHYDELRWAGKKISRVITLGHPYYGKVVDPAKVTPWLCTSRDDFDCRVQRWLWGWQNWLGTTPGHIDDTDFPQVVWSAIAGDGLDGMATGPGGISPEAEGDACLAIFGGVQGADVEGDTSVPIQSSLGIDEHGHFPVASLSFDEALQVRCTHNASCMMRNSLIADPERIPTAVVSDDAVARALDFDGTADQLGGLGAAALATLRMTNALTIEAWIWPDAEGQSGIVVNKEGEYELGLVDGELGWALAVDAPAWSWVRTGVFPPLHQWTHVAFVYHQEAGTGVVYVDGLEVHAAPVIGAIGDVLSQNDFRIGGRESAGQHFAGRIGDVRVWASGRTAQQLQSAAGGAAADQSDPDLRGWWTFDEDAGDVVVDASSHGNHLSLAALGDSPVRRAEDRIHRGGAMYFDGEDDRVTVTDPAMLDALEMGDAVTIEAWLFPRGPGGARGGVVINKEGEYAVTRLADGTIAVSLAGTDLGWVTAPTAATAAERSWTHIAVTYANDGLGVQVYKNGVAVDTIAVNGSIGDFHPDSNELWIGGRQQTDNDQWFHGVVDEVRVWNVRRTPNQVKQFHDRLLPTWSRDGLRGYWRFDEVSGALAIDTSDGANHGSLARSASPSTTPTRSFGPALPGYPMGLLLPETDPVMDTAGCGCNVTTRGTSPTFALWILLAVLALLIRSPKTRSKRPGKNRLT